LDSRDFSSLRASEAALPSGPIGVGEAWRDSRMTSGMAAPRRSPPRKRSSALASGSWLALLAATSLGVDGASTVRAEVRSDEDLVESRDYRLVVQSFDRGEGTRPSFRARPVASYQRAVTAAELRKGVHVSLVELRRAAIGHDDGAVLAWIEAGKPDLEFDGRTARPRPGSMFGLGRKASGTSPVQIRLTRKAA
jgi:hypothetical protein